MKNLPRFIVLLAIGVTFLGMGNLAADELKVGDSAPAVTGTTETGAKLNLADVYKQQEYTLVYFYPKSFTPGCTAQGCSLRDAYADLTKHGVAVVGVSMDKVDTQEDFKNKEGFQFTLLSDCDKNVINAFGVPTKKIPGLGEIAMRQAFLIKDGKVVWCDYHAKTSQQAEDVLKVVNGNG